MRIARAARGLLWLALLALAACSGETLHRQQAYVFGTRVEVVVHGSDMARAEQALAAVLQEFDRLHRAFHAWEPSQLTALNEAIAAGEPSFEVSAELARILGDAQRLAALGDGLFDPALGRLIALWGFHGDAMQSRLPQPAAIDALLAHRPTIADLHIDGQRVSSDNRLVQLDLGGYAKGYALDRAAAILDELGISDALINIGGNVMALGAKGNQPWRIGIQHPRAGAPLASMPLYAGEAVGTSGDYERYFEVGGRRYSHLLDPRSGYPADQTRSLTVLVTPGEQAGTLSDAASKPLFIAGDRWPDYAKRLGIRHAMRVSAAGRIEVTRPLQARIEYHGDASADAIIEVDR